MNKEQLKSELLDQCHDLDHAKVILHSIMQALPKKRGSISKELEQEAVAVILGNSNH
jgi:hypothetical protein